MNRPRRRPRPRLEGGRVYRFFLTERGIQTDRKIPINSPVSITVPGMPRAPIEDEDEYDSRYRAPPSSLAAPDLHN